MKYRYASINRTTSGKWYGCVSQSKVNRKYITRTFSLYLTEKESSAGFVCKKSCGMLSKYWFDSVNICEIMRLRTNLISLVLKIISFFFFLPFISFSFPWEYRRQWVFVAITCTIIRKTLYLNRLFWFSFIFRCLCRVYVHFNSHLLGLATN